MELPKKILVPVDLSVRSELAVEYATMIAASVGAELVVMTNLDLPQQAALDEFAASEDIAPTEAARAAIRRVILKQAGETPTSIVVTSRDDAAEGILDVASAEGVELIVLASHGRSGMTRWLLGSVAEKIVRSAPVPVTIVPARE